MTFKRASAGKDALAVHRVPRMTERSYDVLLIG